MDAVHEDSCTALKSPYFTYYGAGPTHAHGPHTPRGPHQFHLSHTLIHSFRTWPLLHYTQVTLFYTLRGRAQPPWILLMGFASWQQQEIFILFKIYKWLWGKNYFLGAKQPGHEVYCTLPTSAEVKNDWSYTPPPLCAFMVWQGISLPLSVFLMWLCYCARAVIKSVC